MKKTLLISSAFLLLMASCTEKDLPITVGTKTLASDTTYVTTPETPQPHNVLLEEFTGASCANCPAAHAVINSLLPVYGSQLIPVAIHPKNIPQGDPYPGAVYDFRTDAGTAIGTTIYGGIAGMPEAGIDRVPFSGNLELTKDKWSAAIAARVGDSSGINLHVTSNYNAATGSDTIGVTISYTKAMTTPQNINVIILEDSLYDLQEDGLSVDTNYVFNSVFRDMVTSVPYGNAILSGVASKEAGRIVKLYYPYTVSSKILFDPKHCRVVAFVTDGASGTIDILQSAQTTF